MDALVPLPSGALVLQELSLFHHRVVSINSLKKRVEVECVSLGYRLRNENEQSSLGWGGWVEGGRMDGGRKEGGGRRTALSLESSLCS